jgi:S-layer protein (TIGR01567 family)
MKKTILQIFTAILVLGLFCGVVAAAPSIITTDPAANSTIQRIVGDILTFSVQTNESTTIDWLVNGASDTNNIITEANTSRLNHTVQSGTYDIKATLVSTGESRTWSVIGGTGNNIPVITLSDPSSSSVSNNIGESRTFNATVSQISSMTWSLDGTFLKTYESVTESSYPISATQGTHTIKVEAQNGNGTAASKSWTWTVNSQSASNSSGNRIWQDGMATTYTWNAQSFSGFYYDLDSGVSSEEMTIKDIGRSIDSGNIEYVTKPTETKFKYNNWGTYQVIGFMAEKYFAGYSGNSSAIKDNISPISEGTLSKILVDSDDRKSVSSGDSLVLEEGYSLSIKEVDINGNSVWIQLEKDGTVVDDGFVSAGQDYVYKTSLGKATDVPVIIVRFGSIFSGTETSAVFVQGLFQISSNYVEVKNGDTFGQMEVKSISSDEIKMENSDNIGLDKGEKIDLMGKIKFQVADASILRFAPILDTSEAGTYELRGTVYDQNINGNSLPTWTPFNFEGFYYNIDEGIGTEELKVEQLDGRNIPSDKLVYQSSPQAVNFKHSKWGNFTVVGFMADKYFAGYPEGAVNGAVDRVSLLSNSILSKVLTDSDDKESMSSGSALALEEGYSLSVKEVDVNGNSVWVQLEKDGKVVDDGFVSANQDYVYKTDVGKATSIPLIIVHFGTVFSGTETSAVFVQGIFQISGDYIEIKDGDTFDKMKVGSVSEDGIKMRNTDDIGLDRGENTTIMNNVNFKTADDSTLRFYPFVSVNSGGSAGGLNISVPDEIIVGEMFNIAVTADGEPVEGVTIKVNANSTGKTNADGIVEYKAENKGALKLTAEKDGYTTVSKNVNVLPPKEEMSLSVSSETVYIGDTINISALKKIGGDPIEGANVSIDGTALGGTGPDGKITYTTGKNGTINITATKEGFKDVGINVNVKDLEAIFEISNIVISPIEVTSGNNATISIDVKNTGNAAGTYNAEMYVNGNVTESKGVPLEVGGNTTVTFQHKEEVAGNYTVGVITHPDRKSIEISIHKEDVAGNYTVGVGEQTATYKVKEKSYLLLYVLIAAVLLIIGGAAYYFTKGGGDIEAIQEKVQELINSVNPKK